MKTRHKKNRKGFTLVELMVAMAITTVMVTILISITSMSLNTWNRSRNEIRASRQAQAMTEIMTRDLEAMVMRSGNDFEWFLSKTGEAIGPGSTQSPNSADLIFFTAATDRYEGKIGTNDDGGGDISAVGYSLRYQDPVGTTGGATDFRTFVLYRKLVNPDETFEHLLGQTELDTAFARYQGDLNNRENFVCENIYQFSVTFQLEYDDVVSGGGKGRPSTIERRNRPINLAQEPGASTEIRVFGNGMKSVPPNADISENTRITAIEVSITVLSDSAMNTIRSGANVPTDFITRNSYQYSKRVEVPRM